MSCICDWESGCGGTGMRRCAGCGGDQCVCLDCNGMGEVDCELLGGCDKCPNEEGL